MWVSLELMLIKTLGSVRIRNRNRESDGRHLDYYFLLNCPVYGPMYQVEFDDLPG